MRLPEKPGTYSYFWVGTRKLFMRLLTEGLRRKALSCLVSQKLRTSRFTMAGTGRATRCVSGADAAYTAAVVD